MKKFYVIIYEEDNTIEGIIENPEHFKNWLFQHNEARKENGEIEENENEFKLIRTTLFTY
jgi:hypothetical protein